MDRGQSAPLLGTVVERVEADLFAGRRRELQVLEAQLRRCLQLPSALYLHGPAGSGKSALLAAFLHRCRERGLVVVVCPRAALDGGLEAVLRALRQSLCGRGGPTAPRAILQALRRRADRGLVLAFDDYDRAGPADPVLRCDIFAQLGRGTYLLLTGRVPPALLWAREPAWQTALAQLPLGALAESESADLLRRHHVADPLAAAEAHAICGGWPSRLVAVAAAVRRWAQATAGAPGPAEAQAVADLRALLLEHFLHPGSRRGTWRAGGDSAFDDAVACAALLPAFDRRSLSALLDGPLPQEAWSGLLELPGVRPLPAGRWTLAEPLRVRLAEAVLRQRPWAASRWGQGEAARPGAVDAPSLPERGGQAREALAVLHDDTALLRTRAAAHFAARFGPGSAAQVRRWLHEAVAAAEGGDPTLSPVASHYYLRRAGAHEVVAELLHLPRSTYFRHHHRALDAVAARLFN